MGAVPVAAIAPEPSAPTASSETAAAAVADAKDLIGVGPEANVATPAIERALLAPPSTDAGTPEADSDGAAVKTSSGPELDAHPDEVVASSAPTVATSVADTAVSSFAAQRRESGRCWRLVGC